MGFRHDGLFSKIGPVYFAGICLVLISIHHAAAPDLFPKKDERPGIFKSPSKPDKKGATEHWKGIFSPTSMEIADE